MAKSNLSNDLTLIANREKLELELHKALLSMYHKGESYAVLVIHLDDIEEIHTVYGVRAGEEVTLSLIKRTARMLRATDSFARVGREEFVVVLSNTTAEDAVIIAQRLLDTNWVNVVVVDDQPIGYSASVGVGCCNTLDKSARDVFHRAVQGMVIAKRKGGDRVVAQYQEKYRGKTMLLNN